MENYVNCFENNRTSVFEEAYMPCYSDIKPIQLFGKKVRIINIRQ